MTLLEKLNRLPPVISRLFAKHNGRLMSDVELCRRTGWGKKRLRRVYRASSWGHVTVEEVDVFLTACGLSWSSQKKQRWLIKLALDRTNGKELDMRHLRARTFWEDGMIKAMNKHVKRLLT